VIYRLDPLTGELRDVGVWTRGRIFAATSMDIDPRGRFLYVSDAGEREVYAFDIDAGTGALNPVAGSPYPVPDFWSAEPISLAVDPSGRYLLAASGMSPLRRHVVVMRIDPLRGSLAPVPGSPFVAELPAVEALAVTGVVE
jgi:6-phosphogluconolactonase (cycloisomerase 2 family)